MSYKNIINKLKKYHQRLNGSTIEYELTIYQTILNEINQLKSEFENKSDEQLKSISQRLMKRARMFWCGPFIRCCRESARPT